MSQLPIDTIGNKNHKLISDYLESSFSSPKIGDTEIKEYKDVENSTIVERTSYFNVKNKNVCRLMLKSSIIHEVTSRSEVDFSRNTTLTLESLTDNLVINRAMIFIKADGVCSNPQNGLEGFGVPVIDAQLSTVVNEMYSLAAALATKPGYSHVLNFRISFDGRALVDLKEREPLLVDGRIGYSVDINSTSTAARFFTWGINRNVTIKAVKSGFEFSVRRNNIVDVNFADLITKLDSFFTSGVLKACFPSKMEHVVDRMLRILNVPLESAYG